jgi:hypothetical protein
MAQIDFYKELDKLREEYPELTFHNDGYENIPDEVRERNKEGQSAIEKLLKDSVVGFVKFQNFKPRKDGSIAIRCQTKWSEFFTGVTYIPMTEFKPENYYQDKQ